MSKGNLDIDLLGTTFAIQADETDEYLNQLYEHFVCMVEQVKNSSSVTDPIRLAIIAGILITDELYKEQFKNNTTSNDVKDNFEIEKATQRMIRQIDFALNGNDENLG